MLNKGDILTADDRRYTITKLLGRGANTAAYLAECGSGGLVTQCILKEYAPRNDDDSDAGRARFTASGRMQNRIRQLAALNNQTPPVSRIFEANGTAYIEVACFGGNTLDRMKLTLPQYMSVCETIAKTVGYYHRSGFICLDLKPENIFILQNASDDTITQLVEFIDFDSVRDITGNGANTVFSYTREWAAPEQLNPYAAGRLGFAADIYTVGEMVYYLLFGKHSTAAEHRGFSKYPFDECRREYRKYTDRPDIQSLFTRLFRGTLRSSASNRFGSIDEVAELLGRIVSELHRKDYIIPKLPAVSPDFVGRDAELRAIADSLSENHVLFLTGVGGIGKSTLVKNYIARYRTEYGAIVYLEYDGDLRHTFCDDMQLQISTVSRRDGESPDDYFTRKLKAFRLICGEKRVLFVVDNFTDRIGKDLSRIIDCGYDTVITTRNQPPKNSFPFMEVKAISDTSELFRLISLDLGRQMTKEERGCFGEIISLVHGHTLVIELIARQIASGRFAIRTALELIRENGFTHFSDEKVGNFKDGEEIYDTASGIITALFDTTALNADARLTLKILALMNVRGLEKSLINKFFPDIREETIAALSNEGWLYEDCRVHLHPVIAETVRYRQWSGEKVKVMEYHKKMTDVYVGMANAAQIREILRSADSFRNIHDQHIIRGMYYDMLGCYYDTLLGGAYPPENDKENQLLEKLIHSAEKAISETERDTDKRSRHYLIKYCLDLASVKLRCMNKEYHEEIRSLLKKARYLIKAEEPQNPEYICYYRMVLAWYHTLAEPNLNETIALTERAEQTAVKVFPTELEIIDIIHIPAANCFYYHGELQMSAAKLEEAVNICGKYPDMLPYIDKRAELLNCLIDICLAMGDRAKCRELLAEIDRINEKYAEHGIFREVPPEKREQII